MQQEIHPHRLFRAAGVLGTLALALLLGRAQAIAADVPWIAVAKSSGQHPIEVARFGNGDKHVLIVGSLSGNEPESLELMDAICQLSRKVAPPSPVTLLMVRTLNPDGMKERVRTNSRGVDLNRNFPSPDFTSIPSRLTGPAPASEVETQYMLRILDEYHPVRIIHLRSGTGERPLVLVNESWAVDHEPESLQLPQDVHFGTFQGAFKVGSLEEFAARQLKTSVSTVYLPQKNFRQLKAVELLRFATAHLGSDAAPENLAGPPSDAAGTFTPNSATPNSADAGRGVVELLPPPPEFASTSRVNRGADRNDSRYFELPPPPR